jgi:hypothetical protein
MRNSNRETETESRQFTIGEHEPATRLPPADAEIRQIRYRVSLAHSENLRNLAALRDRIERLERLERLANSHVHDYGRVTTPKYIGTWDSWPGSF